MLRVCFEEHEGLVSEPANADGLRLVTLPELWGGVVPVGQSSVDCPAACARRARSASSSSFPTLTSASNCWSHASASNSANHSRNLASSAGESVLICSERPPQRPGRGGDQVGEARRS